MAAARAIGRIGPNRLTLADVAAEAGVSAATLVQRFGGKRELLLALVRSSDGAAKETFARVRAGRGPLEAVLEYGRCVAGMARTPEELSNHLAFLQIDLTDPDFHAPTLAHSRATRDELVALLRDAVGHGELSADCDVIALARTVHTAVTGSLLTWAVYREGSAEEWVREDLLAVLGPYRASGEGPGEG